MATRMNMVLGIAGVDGSGAASRLIEVKVGIGVPAGAGSDSGALGSGPYYCLANIYGNDATRMMPAASEAGRVLMPSRYLKRMLTA